MRARLREKLDIPDHRDAEFRRMTRNGMRVERHAGADDRAVVAGQVGLERIGEHRPPGEGLAPFRPRVPGEHMGSARQQRLHRSLARAGQAENGKLLAGPGGADDHRSFSVASPRIASTMATIQKRITTLLSLQPNCSKW